MAEIEFRRVIHSAQERASLDFLAVVQRSMQDADNRIAKRLLSAKSDTERSVLMASRRFFHQEGNVFLLRVDELFRASLERALQTMYIDMRPDMRKVSIDELSLIDDEVVTHQIEVGRLTERMRDANRESIGRLNVIIAQMHGRHEARERENPFRPYLLARALYDGMRGLIGDEGKIKILFDHLSEAVVQHLPGYYNAIREVFEASGIHGRFVAQRSKNPHYQRYFAAPMDQSGLSMHLAGRMLPGLQRVLEGLHGTIATTGMATSDDPARVQDFIRKMFKPSKSFVLSPNGEFNRTALAKPAAMPVSPLVAQLGTLQKNVARADLTDDEKRLEPDALPALRERINLAGASPMERMMIEVISMLFEFILEDDRIPAIARWHLSRLQVPIVKAAVIDPDLTHDEEHPARKLLNRMSMAVTSIDPSAHVSHTLIAEIERIVDKVLKEFDVNISVFSGYLQEFELFISDSVRRENAQTARGIEAMEEAEKFSILLTNTTNMLCDALLPFNADKRISDFIIHVWPHVLVRAAAIDAECNRPPLQTDSEFIKYRAVLSELLWSVQEKQDADERSALMRLLPSLVKRFRQALELIQLPDDESREILDQLVEMHTAVLRAVPKSRRQKLPRLDELHQGFSRLTIDWNRASWELNEPPQARAAVIEDVFARRGVAAELSLGMKTVTATQADQEFLAQTYLLGTRVAFNKESGDQLLGRLVWTSSHRSLYLFKRENDGGLVLYTYASLLEALREEMVRPVEYAPVFERAIESLLLGAEQFQTASA